MEKTRPGLPLLEALISRMRLPWYAASAIIVAVLTLLIFLAAFLDGTPLAERDWLYWRVPVLPLAIVCYILAIYPFMRRLREQAIASLMPMLEADPVSRLEIAADLSMVRRGWEIASAWTGILFWLAISLPWVWVRHPMEIYASGMEGLMLAVLGWLVFSGLDGTRRISRLARHQLKTDIFATGKLVPVANWSLGISLAFLGGISISLLFQPIENLRHWQSSVFYAGLIIVAIVVFFLSMWSTHAVIARSKRDELAMVRKNLDLALREMKEGTSSGTPQTRDSAYSAVSAWSAYERRVREVPEWPYNAIVARRLAASVVVPGVVYLLRFLFGIRV